MMNIINGGAHSDAPIDFQEFMIVPERASTRSPRPSAPAPRFSTPSRSVLKAKGLQPRSATKAASPRTSPPPTDALDAIAEAVKGAGYKLGKDIFLALDVASSEFYVKEQKTYVFKKSDERSFTGDEFVGLLQGARAPNTRSSPSRTAAPRTTGPRWKKLTDAIGDKVQLVGDDLFVTNVEFLQKGIDTGTANSILVKVNQIGSLTETLDAVELAHKSNGYTRRHLAPLRRDRGRHHRRHRGRHELPARSRPAPLCRTDRVAKYNQLLRIEEELGATAIVGGTHVRLAADGAPIAITAAYEAEPVHQASATHTPGKAGPARSGLLRRRNRRHGQTSAGARRPQPLHQTAAIK